MSLPANKIDEMMPSKKARHHMPDMTHAAVLGEWRILAPASVCGFMSEHDAGKPQSTGGLACRNGYAE
jgi:hypothetical protein